MCEYIPEDFNIDKYIFDIDQQAQERLNTIIHRLTQAQGITEELKAVDQVAWISRMNNIQASATEIVNQEIIYA